MYQDVAQEQVDSSIVGTSYSLVPLTFLSVGGEVLISMAVVQHSNGYTMIRTKTRCLGHVVSVTVYQLQSVLVAEIQKQQFLHSCMKHHQLTTL